jgi:hypothetical protein
MYQFLSLALLLLITGCANSDNKSGSQSKELSIFDVILLDAEVINTEENEIYRISQVSLVDTLLVISSLTDHKLLSTYDHDGYPLNTYGTFGRGPNDIKVPIPRFYDSVVLNDDTYLSSYNMNSMNLDVLNLSRTIDEKKVVIDHTIELPKSLFPVIKPYYINNELVVAYYNDTDMKVLNGKSGLTTYYPNTGRFSTIQFPLFSFDQPELENDFEYQLAYQGINAWLSDFNSSKNRIVLAHALGSQIFVYEIQNDSLNLIKDFHYGNVQQDSEFNYSKFKDGDGLARKFIDIQATNDFIYLNVSKEPLDQISYGDENRELIKLDYDGNLITKYQFPDSLKIEFFTVNESKSLFYGIDVSQDKLYKLSTIK